MADHTYLAVILAAILDLQSCDPSELFMILLDQKNLMIWHQNHHPKMREVMADHRYLAVILAAIFDFGLGPLYILGTSWLCFGVIIRNLKSWFGSILGVQSNPSSSIILKGKQIVRNSFNNVNLSLITLICHGVLFGTCIQLNCLLYGNIFHISSVLRHWKGHFLRFHICINLTGNNFIVVVKQYDHFGEFVQVRATCIQLYRSEKFIAILILFQKLILTSLLFKYRIWFNQRLVLD